MDHGGNGTRGAPRVMRGARRTCSEGPVWQAGIYALDGMAAAACADESAAAALQGCSTACTGALVLA